MSKNEERRNFLAQGAAATAGLFAAGAVSGQEPTVPSQMKMNHADHESGTGWTHRQPDRSWKTCSWIPRSKLASG